MIDRPIISDFTLRGEVVMTTRMGATIDDPKSVAISLHRWR
jgi:hypothetical protein